MLTYGAVLHCGDQFGINVDVELPLYLALFCHISMLVSELSRLCVGRGCICFYRRLKLVLRIKRAEYGVELTSTEARLKAVRLVGLFRILLYSGNDAEVVRRRFGPQAVRLQGAQHTSYLWGAP